MRIVYPVLWSRPERKACHAQSMATVAALARLGHDVTVLAPRRATDPALDAEALRSYHGVTGDFRVEQRRSRWVGDPAIPSSLWLRQLVRDPVVRASDVLLSRIPNLLAHDFGCPIPFAVDHYRPWPDQLPFLRPLFRRQSRQSASLGIILHSDFAAESYRRLGVAPEKLLVAHNGFDPKPFERAMTRSEARAATGLPQDRKIVLYAGRVNEEKGLDQVFALADREPDILFVLVGSEGDGPIEQQARSHDNVQVLPWQRPEALPHFLQTADVLIVPPSSAPLKRGNCILPLKLFSYLAAGRPILAPVAPDTAGLLVHDENAWLVPPDDPDIAAQGLRRLLGDQLLADRLADAAAERARSLTWDNRAVRVTDFLEKRLSESRRG